MNARTGLHKAIFVTLFFLRLLLQYRWKLLFGRTRAQAVGYPSGSRRALLSCTVSTAVYLGTWFEARYLVGGDRVLWEAA